MDLEEKFGDVRFVCMGGSSDRMATFANLLAESGLITLPIGTKLAPVGKTERYTVYKVGPVICASHGIGMASMSVLLHELFKLLYHARVRDVTFIRIGTSGGIGLESGTVVVANEAVNSIDFKPIFETPVLGQLRSLSSQFNEELVDQVLEFAKDLTSIRCVKGKTMSTDDFYEEQGRRDGAFCDFEEKDRIEWLKKAEAAGIVNIEMEGLFFGAFCNRANVKAILCNVVLLNRLNGDQVLSTPEELAKMSENSQRVILHYILKTLGTPTKERH